MSKKAGFLDRTQWSLVRDIAYEEYDRVKTGSTVYGDNEGILEELKEILDMIDELLED